MILLTILGQTPLMIASQLAEANLIVPLLRGSNNLYTTDLNGIHMSY